MYALQKVIRLLLLAHETITVDTVTSIAVL